MTSFVEERKNAKFQILKKKDVVLNVEELTTIIKVHTKLFLNEDDVNLYALKAIPKPQEIDMPSIMTLNEEVDIEKAIFLISLKDLNMQEKKITCKAYFISTIPIFLQVIEMLIYIISF
jgi:hypothetical protein